MIMYNGKANYTAAALKATVYVAQYDDDDAIIGWALDSFASAVVEDAEVELFNTDSDETIEVILVTDADK